MNSCCLGSGLASSPGDSTPPIPTRLRNVTMVTASILDRVSATMSSTAQTTVDGLYPLREHLGILQVRTRSAAYGYPRCDAPQHRTERDPSCIVSVTLMIACEPEREITKR